jgi:hypothetical protein
MNLVYRLPFATEYERLRADHVRLMQEHRGLQAKRFDAIEHAEHKNRLRAHIEALAALRRAYEAEWQLLVPVQTVTSR